MDTRDLERSIDDLNAGKESWARMPVGRKAEYLDRIIDGCLRIAPHQAAVGNRAKGYLDGTPMGGEEWAHPYAVIRLLRLLRASLRQIGERGRPLIPRGAVRTRRDGQVVARVFPLSKLDLLLYQGFSGEIWMQPEVTEQNLPDHMAGFYREENPAGKVALVLGAGNVASVGPSDLAHKLFVEGQVCLYKHNPVNEYLAPFLEEAFAPVIQDGFLRTATGGPETGEYLCMHPGIDEIHLTGSDRTYEAIVFGPGPEGLERKKTARPRLEKRFTCELGNATPAIIVPGRWSEADIRFHAENLATQVVNNCGFNCLAARVLVLHRDWPQAGCFLQALRDILAAAPPRKAYYPGAENRYEEVISRNPSAQPLGKRAPGFIPYTLIPGLDPADRENPCFATECFMPLLAQTSLPGADAAGFLSNAVDFLNGTLWGTLSASVVIHPRDQRLLAGRFEEEIARLRYGTIGVNHWTALGYVIGSTSWGAYPGHTSADIQSGTGTVHNSFLFDRPQKSVLYGPFRVWPKPAWFITNRQIHRIFPEMVRLESKPSLGRALRIATIALKG